jgi:hypothetical protein
MRINLGLVVASKWPWSIDQPHVGSLDRQDSRIF